MGTFKRTGGRNGWSVVFGIVSTHRLEAEALIKEITRIPANSLWHPWPPAKIFLEMSFQRSFPMWSAFYKYIQIAEFRFKPKSSYEAVFSINATGTNLMGAGDKVPPSSISLIISIGSNSKILVSDEFTWFMFPFYLIRPLEILPRKPRKASSL